MSGLEDRVREAVGRAWRESGGDPGLGVRNAFVAFLGVLEDSFDLPTPDPADDRARLLADGNAVVDMLTEMGADTGEAPRPLLLCEPTARAVAALHEVLRIARDPSYATAIVRLQRVDFAAREALKALGDEVPS